MPVEALNIFVPLDDHFKRAWPELPGGFSVLVSSSSTFQTSMHLSYGAALANKSPPGLHANATTGVWLTLYKIEALFIDGRAT